MPRLTNSTPKYRKHRASGQAIVTLDGKDFYLGPHGTRVSRSEYDRLVGEWMQNGRHLPSSRGGGAPDPAVVELVARFWSHAKSYYGGDGNHGGELGSYKLALGHLKRIYGRTEICDFNPLALKTVRQAIVDAGWSRTYVNRQVGRLKHVFKWGVANGIVDGELYRDLLTVEGLRVGKTKARETEPVKPVPDAHVDAVKEHVPRQVWAMIELQRLTGMRPGEVVIMRTQDIDTTGTLWQYVPPKHKTQHHGHDRTVYFGPRAQAVLKSWLRPIVGEYLFQPCEAEAERREKAHAAEDIAESREQTRQQPPEPAGAEAGSSVHR